MTALTATLAIAATFALIYEKPGIAGPLLMATLAAGFLMGVLQ